MLEIDKLINMPPLNLQVEKLACPDRILPLGGVSGGFNVFLFPVQRYALKSELIKIYLL